MSCHALSSLQGFHSLSLGAVSQRGGATPRVGFASLSTSVLASPSCSCPCLWLCLCSFHHARTHSRDSAVEPGPSDRLAILTASPSDSSASPKELSPLCPLLWDAESDSSSALHPPSVQELSLERASDPRLESEARLPRLLLGELGCLQLLWPFSSSTFRATLCTCRTASPTVSLSGFSASLRPEVSQRLLPSSGLRHRLRPSEVVAVASARRLLVSFGHCVISPDSRAASGPSAEGDSLQDVLPSKPGPGSHRPLAP